MEYSLPNFYHFRDAAVYRELQQTQTERLVYKSSVWGLGGWTLLNHHYYDPISKTIFFGQGIKKVADLQVRSISPYGQVYVGSDESVSEIYLFDALGRHLETKSSLVGATVWKFEYDSANRLAQIRDRNDQVTEFLRSASGDLTGIRSPRGQVTTVQLNTSGKITSITDPEGGTFQFSYAKNGLGNMVQMISPIGLVTNFEYDARDKFIRETKNTGGVFQLTFSQNQSVMSMIIQTIGTYLRMTTDLNAVDQASVITDKNNAAVRTTKYTDSSDASLGYSVDVASSVSPDIRVGATGRFPSLINTNWKGNGVLTKTEEFDQSVTYLSGSGPFNIDQLVTSYTVAGLTSQSIYHGRNRTLETITPLGRQSQIRFDEKEQISRIEQPGLLSTDFIYDQFGNIRTIIQGQRTTDYEYNANGLSKVTDPFGKETLFERDQNGRVTKQTLPNLEEIRFRYTASGNIKEVQTPNGQVHLFEQNYLDKIKSYLPPAIGGSNGQTVYTYDADGRRQKITEPSGQYAEYFYKDGTNIVERISTSLGDYTFQNLDVDGRWLRAFSPDGISTQVIWSGPQLVTLRTDFNPGVYSVNLQLDNQFRVNRIQSGDTYDIKYDDDNRISQVGVANFSYGESALAQSAYTEVLGNMNNFSWRDRFADNGLEQQQSTALAYNYTNGSQKIWTISKQILSNGDVLETDLVQMKTGSDISDIRRDQKLYRYDKNHRLIEVRNPSGGPISSYVMGTNNNISEYNHYGKRTVAEYDEQDRLLRLRGSISKEFSYDASGRISSITNCYGTKHFEYDVFGNLKSVTLASGKVITYKYDVFNRRAVKSVNGSVSEYYTWFDDTRLSAIYNSNGLLSRAYVYGPGSRAPVYIFNGSNSQRLKVLSDARGSIRAVIDNNGNSVQEIEYDEYGMVLKDSSVTSQNALGFQPLGFASGLMDRDTGLVRFGARDYDPVIGRWTSKDPIGFAGGDTNLYGYVGGDPVNFVDPRGLWAFQVGGSISGLLGPLIGVGGSAESGIAISYSAQYGFQIAGYQSAGVRAGTGLYGGMSLNLSWTQDAQRVSDLNGGGITKGFDTPLGGYSKTTSGGTCGNPSMNTHTIGFGPGVMGDAYWGGTGTWVGAPLTFGGSQ